MHEGSKWLFVGLIVILSACAQQRETEGVRVTAIPWASSMTALSHAPARSPTPKPTATVTRSPSNTATPSPTETATPVPSATATVVPATATSIPPTATLPPPTATLAPSTAPTLSTAATGVVCFDPPKDYGRVTVRGHSISTRTLAMLENAQALYGGPGNLMQVTQGSYSTSIAASFGTHDGGGAVDISIRHPETGEPLYGEVERMVQALRQAGFAAWYRTRQQGFVPHIHAIAVGDTELSEAAQAQLTGEHGYFRGRNGLPQPAIAGADPHGGPLLCAWMEELGYMWFRSDEPAEPANLWKDEG